MNLLKKVIKKSVLKTAQFSILDLITKLTILLKIEVFSVRE